MESGRIWQLTIEDFLYTLRLSTIPGLQQVFVKYDDNGNIILIVTKVVNDMLMAGSRMEIMRFHDKMTKKFKVGSFLIDKPIVFNRLHIKQGSDFSITASMQEFLEQINPIHLCRERRKQQNSLCTAKEITAFKSLAGSLNFLGHGALTVASFAASYLQQNISKL